MALRKIASFLLRATPESIDVNSSREKCLLKTKKKGVCVWGGVLFIARLRTAVVVSQTPAALLSHADRTALAVKTRKAPL